MRPPTQEKASLSLVVIQGAHQIQQRLLQSTRMEIGIMQVTWLKLDMDMVRSRREQ